MAIRNFAKYCALALMAIACTVQEPNETQAPINSEPVVSDIVPGKATVLFTEEMTALVEDDAATAMKDLGIVSMTRTFPYAGEFEGRTRRAGLHRFYNVTFKANVSTTKAISDLSEVPGIESVTPVHHKKMTGFNDPMLSKQWHYINKSYTGGDINVEKVWEQYTTGSSRVIVNVVDEPVDASHPDLQANLWTDDQGHTGYNFARGNFTYTANDPGWDLSIRPKGGRISGDWYNGDYGHGTHVAGTVAAVNNNGVGVCGVAGGDYAQGKPGVRIQSSAIFSGYDCYPSDDDYCAIAIKWGADHGAVISQNSWGPTENISSRTKIDTYDPALKAAIDYFIEFAGCDDSGVQLPDSPMKGGLVLFASGNSNYNWDPYGGYEPVIAVGATGITGAKASYSNYGSWVDVAAPGGDGSNGVWSTLPEKVNDDGDDGGSVISTNYYGGDDWQGTSMACPHASGVAALIVSYFGQQGFTADDAKAILFGGLGSTIGGSKPVGKKLNALASFEWALENGYTPGDDSGADGNKCPWINLSQTVVTLKAHQTTVVDVDYGDPDDDPVDFVCETTGSDAAVYDAASKKLLVTASKAPAGTYSAVFKVTDKPSAVGAEAKSATATFTYTILPNHAPEVVKRIADVSKNDAAVLSYTGLDAYFTDPDGETLSFSVVTENEAVAKAEISGTTLAVVPIRHGITTIHVIAMDGLGASAEFTFKVAIVDPDQPVTVDNQAVTDVVDINIDSTDPTPVDVSIYNASGTLVLQYTATASVFYSVEIDVSRLAPGRYTAVLKYNGQTKTVKFAKY